MSPVLGMYSSLSPVRTVLYDKCRSISTVAPNQSQKQYVFPEIETFIIQPTGGSLALRQDSLVPANAEACAR